MHAFSHMAAALSLSALISTCAGYYVDQISCTAQDTAFIQSIVNQAFSMVYVTVADAQEDPMDDQVAFLIQKLFGLTDQDALDLVNSVFVQSAPDATGAITGITVFQDYKTALPVPLNEVVIFCTEDRIVPHETEPEWNVDRVAMQAVRPNTYCSGSPGTPRALMYTTRFYNNWDSIQICQWFLDYALDHGWHLLTEEDIALDHTLLEATGFSQYLPHSETDIDLYSLFGRSMLHEFMHTSPGGGKVDVNGIDSYGWQMCTNMPPDEAVNNADSFSLLASASFWAAKGRVIDATGNFINP